MAGLPRSFLRAHLSATASAPSAEAASASRGEAYDQIPRIGLVVLSIILAKTYQLSKGNPIEDTIEVLEKLNRQILDQGAELKILGVGTTGYAKDILKDVIGADAALVETVAHTEAGLHFYDNVDVICDVGGQDIKIIVTLVRIGQRWSYRLNSGTTSTRSMLAS